MNRSISILLFLLGLSISISAQNQIEIAGKIIDMGRNEAIPFANIYNKNSKKGTISNTDGYFRILINKITDTITVSYIGYKEQTIKIIKDKPNYLITLEQNTLLLSEITVTPNDHLYLFELLQECKKSISNTERKSKAYYELKSFVDNRQIELVEGYYNINTQGYALHQLDMKAARVAVRAHKNRCFTSIETSRALLMLNIFGINDYFPINPMQLSKSKLKEKYNLHLESKYLDRTKDSIYVIDYQPKDSTGQFFGGRIWMNKSKSQLLKITLNCDKALKHPFLPLFSTDKITNVSLNITQSFDQSNAEVVFNHTDFIYKIDYCSRMGKAEAQNYTIQTNAVLYAYDYENTFLLPHLDFKNGNIGDYRKINAMPYNEFFWTYNDEYRMNDSMNANELFFNDSTSLNNKTLFQSNSISKQGLFEHPFISWSENRIQFRKIVSDSSVNNTATGFNEEQYNLAVKIFADFNSYKDSIHFITSTIIDPYESYYNLPMNNQTHCFINIYFDLCEIARRELEEKLNIEKTNISHAEETYKDFLSKLETKNREYLNAVERGTNQQEMVKYNKIVFEKLKIDNMDIFQAYPEHR